MKNAKCSWTWLQSIMILIYNIIAMNLTANVYNFWKAIVFSPNFIYLDRVQSIFNINTNDSNKNPALALVDGRPCFVVDGPPTGSSWR